MSSQVTSSIAPKRCPDALEAGKRPLHKDAIDHSKFLQSLEKQLASELSRLNLDSQIESLKDLFAAKESEKLLAEGRKLASQLLPSGIKEKSPKAAAKDMEKASSLDIKNIQEGISIVYFNCIMEIARNHILRAYDDPEKMEMLHAVEIFVRDQSKIDWLTMDKKSALLAFANGIKQAEQSHSMLLCQFESASMLGSCIIKAMNNPHFDSGKNRETATPQQAFYGSFISQEQVPPLLHRAHSFLRGDFAGLVIPSPAAKDSPKFEGERKEKGEKVDAGCQVRCSFAFMLALGVLTKDATLGKLGDAGLSAIDLLDAVRGITQAKPENPRSSFLPACMLSKHTLNFAKLVNFEDIRPIVQGAIKEINKIGLAQAPKYNNTPHILTHATFQAMQLIGTKHFKVLKAPELSSIQKDLEKMHDISSSKETKPSLDKLKTACDELDAYMKTGNIQNLESYAIRLLACTFENALLQYSFEPLYSGRLCYPGIEAASSSVLKSVSPTANLGLFESYISTALKIQFQHPDAICNLDLWNLAVANYNTLRINGKMQRIDPFCNKIQKIVIQGMHIISYFEHMRQNLSKIYAHELRNYEAALKELAALFEKAGGEQSKVMLQDCMKHNEATLSSVCSFKMPEGSKALNERLAAYKKQLIAEKEQALKECPTDINFTQPILDDKLGVPLGCLAVPAAEQSRTFPAIPLIINHDMRKQIRGKVPLDFLVAEKKGIGRFAYEYTVIKKSEIVDAIPGAPSPKSPAAVKPSAPKPLLDPAWEKPTALIFKVNVKFVFNSQFGTIDIPLGSMSFNGEYRDQLIFNRESERFATAREAFAVYDGWKNATFNNDLSLLAVSHEVIGKALSERDDKLLSQTRETLLSPNNTIGKDVARLLEKLDTIGIRLRIFSQFAGIDEAQLKVLDEIWNSQKVKANIRKTKRMDAIFKTGSKDLQQAIASLESAASASVSHSVAHPVMYKLLELCACAGENLLESQTQTPAAAVQRSTQVTAFLAMKQLKEQMSSEITNWETLLHKSSEERELQQQVERQLQEALAREQKERDAVQVEKQALRAKEAEMKALAQRLSQLDAESQQLAAQKASQLEQLQQQFAESEKKVQKDEAVLQEKESQLAALAARLQHLDAENQKLREASAALSTKAAFQAPADDKKPLASSPAIARPAIATASQKGRPAPLAPLPQLPELEDWDDLPKSGISKSATLPEPNEAGAKGIIRSLSFPLLHRSVASQQGKDFSGKTPHSVDSPEKEGDDLTVASPEKDDDDPDWVITGTDRTDG